MALQLICGNCGTGKTFLCFEKIKKCIENDSEAIMIVPDQYSMEHEKKLSLFLGKGRKSQANVYSFLRFSYTMFCVLGGVSREYVSAAGKNMIMSRLLMENRKKFKVFGNSAGYGNFATELTDLISELKRYNITPQILKDISEQIKDESYLKNKLSDLFLVYKDFEETLSKNGCDTDDNLAYLKKLLQDYDGLQNTSFYIDSFTNFTPNELSIIEILIKKAKNVTLTLCIGDESRDSVFSPSLKTKDIIVSMAQREGIQILPEISLKGNKCEGKNPMLCSLPDRVFDSFSKNIHDNLQGVYLQKCKNIYSEVSLAAQKIIGDCKNKGTRFFNYKIVVTSMEEYAPVIEEIFPLYNIAFFIDDKRDILNHPLISLSIYALEAVAGNFTQEAVFKYLKNGMFFDNVRKTDVFENYCLSHGIKWSFFETDEKWQEEETKALRDELMGPVIRFKQKLSLCKTVKDYCITVYEHIEELSIPQKLEKSIEYFMENNDAVLAEEYSRIFGIFIETLEQLVESLGDEEINLRAFIDLWRVSLAEFKISLVPPCIDQVEITTPSRFEGKETDVLIILGASDGEFPKTSMEEGILPSSDREDLAALGLLLAPPAKERLSESEFNAYRLLSAPKKELIISYAVEDKENIFKTPSVVISKILSAYKNASLLTEEDMPYENVFLSQHQGLSALLQATREAYLGGENGPVMQAAREWYLGSEKWSGLYKNANAALKYVNNPSPLPTEIVKKALGGEIAVSVSQLERYARCEFSYFMQYLLKAKERDVYKISAIEFGSIMHKALEEFSFALKEDNKSWDDINDKYIKEKLKIIIDDCCRDMAGGILKSTKRYEFFSSKTERIMQRCIGLIADQFKNSDFKPLGYEIDFDKRGAYPPMVLDVDGEKILLRGKIDRADILDEGEEKFVRIVDYKSGNKTLSFGDVYFGLSLQLLTYLNALLKSLSRKGTIKINPGGVLYFRIANPIIPKNHPIPEEEAEIEIKKALRMNGILLQNEDVIKKMDKLMVTASDVLPVSMKEDKLKSSSSLANSHQFKRLLEYSQEKAKNIATNILSGNISINPYINKTEDACRFCPYNIACGFDECINERRKLEGITKDEFFKLVAKEGE